MPIPDSAPVSDGSSLDLDTRRYRDVVGARLDHGQARALVRYCVANTCSQSEAIRRALIHLGARKTRLVTASKDDPEALLDAVAKAIGLDPAAVTPEELLARVRELVDSLPAPPAAGGENAAPPAPAGPAITAAAAREDLRAATWVAARAKQRADRARPGKVNR
jgi:hypothetical protein